MRAVDLVALDVDSGRDYVFVDLVADIVRGGDEAACEFGVDGVC